MFHTLAPSHDSFTITQKTIFMKLSVLSHVLLQPAWPNRKDMTTIYGYAAQAWPPGAKNVTKTNRFCVYNL